MIHARTTPAPLREPAVSPSAHSRRANASPLSRAYQDTSHVTVHVMFTYRRGGEDSRSMLAARLKEGGVVVVETVPIPEPKVGEARIQIIQGGICATDVELTRGYKGGALSHTLGHEFVARIDKLNIGAASQKPCHVAEGQRVVAEINCVADSCGCRDYHERAQHPERKAIGIFGADGAFAEYAIVPIVNIHPVPASVTDDEAMFVEPLAAACQISQQVHLQAGDRVAVVGTGKLGILIAQALAAVGGVRVTAFGRRDANFHMFQERGIEARLTESIDKAQEKFDIVVDCTGNQQGFDTALNLVRPRGTLVLKSTFEGHTPANLTKVVVDEITLIGSRCGPFALALKLLEMRRVSVSGLITHRFPLAQADEAIKMAASKESMKVALTISSSTTGGQQ